MVLQLLLGGTLGNDSGQKDYWDLAEFSGISEHGWQGVFLNISKGIKWFEYRLTICREVVKYYLTDLVRKGGPQISEN